MIPVAGSLRIQAGGVYKWSLRIKKKCSYRPQMQFGLHGLSHEKPWRLVTTSRCSRSRDDDPWVDRPQGDKLIDEGDQVNVVCDMRPSANTFNPQDDSAGGEQFGTFGFSINDGPFELVFTDVPTDVTLVPVVSMGGDSSSIELLPN